MRWVVTRASYIPPFAKGAKDGAPERMVADRVCISVLRGAFDVIDDYGFSWDIDELQFEAKGAKVPMRQWVLIGHRDGALRHGGIGVQIGPRKDKVVLAGEARFIENGMLERET